MHSAGNVSLTPNSFLVLAYAIALAESLRMMKDFTRNLFYFFRGPSSDDNSVRDRQLENNLTKSLIVVLEHTDKDFLQALAEKLGLATPLRVADVLSSAQAGWGADGVRKEE